MHNQMAHGIVSIDERRGWHVADGADGRARVDAARPQSLHVKGKTHHAMRIAAAQIGLGHERGDELGVILRQPRSVQHTLNETAKRVCANARYLAVNPRVFIGHQPLRGALQSRSSNLCNAKVCRRSNIIARKHAAILEF
jgi:hypothetical protein